MSDFLGLPDDIARVALQRLLECDARSRAHRRAAKRWSKSSILISVFAVILSSVAAVAASKSFDQTIVVALSIAAAVISATQAAVNSNERMEKHRSAGTAYEALANDLDKFLNLQLGPVMWRNLQEPIANLQKPLDEIDARFKLAGSVAPPVKIDNTSIIASKARAQRVIEYLEMPNVKMPPDETWTN